MNAFDLIEMKIPAKAEYVSVARLSIAGIANRMGFDYEAIEDLKVAISEAVTNTVQHAYASDGYGEVTIECGVYADRLEMIVNDRGDSFDMEEIKRSFGPYKRTKPVENLHEGGFGLYIIDALMDHVEINNTYGVTVLMTKYLRKTEVDLNGDQISSKQS